MTTTDMRGVQTLRDRQAPAGSIKKELDKVPLSEAPSGVL